VTTNVLIDRHHAGLFHSLQLLGDRLGWTIYTPIGHEWWDRWYWQFGIVYGDDRLAQQYLSHGEPEMRDEEFPDRLIHGVTLEVAQAMSWDLVMATVQENQAGFKRFADEHGAKYAVHVGNTNQYIDQQLNPLILNASEMPGGVRIGEEFDSAGLFGYTPPWLGMSDSIVSFVNCMPSIACYPLLEQADDLLPATIYVYGEGGPDGVVRPISHLAGKMRAAKWGWHDKEHGDGYGHVLHYWAAIGRPLIGHGSHYREKMGNVYWRDLETCIDLDKHSIPETVGLIREISADPARHAEMCRAIRAVFDRETDWQRDADQVAELISLVPA
jgi:hypothetical protein